MIASANKIAFVSGRYGNPEIYVVNANVTGVRRLTHNPKFDGFPHWSPDGRKILFYSQRSGLGDAWIMNADGSRQHDFTRSPAHDSGDSWSPDGKKIVLESNRAGPSDQLYVMNADGAGV